MNTKVVGITFASTMVFVTITSGLLLCSSSTHATDDSAVTVTEITVPSSCSMTANVSTPHIADIVNGNRAINIGKTTLSTFCNDPGGFAIYAIGYTNNELGSTDVIASNNTDTIATGNTAPSNNSSWGMKVVNSSSSSFPATITPYFNVATNDGYVAVPSTFTLMASRNSGTAMNSATLLDTTYGAYISSTQPVGEYNGQVLYTMVHPSSAAGPNAGTMFEAAFLMQPTPPTKKTVGSNSYYKMQDMTPDICTVMSIGAEGQMVDDRDDKIYWVLKAKDGKCWMTQNLDHNIVTTANFYTPANTDVSVNTTMNAATIPSTSITSAGAFTGWTNDNTHPYSADPGDWYFTDTYYNDACNSDPWCRFTNPSADATTLSKFSTTPYAGNGTHGHVGNYYNWTAAIASNDSSSYTTSTLDDVSKSPQTSICPAGWRLPTISSTLYNDDYTTLLNAYNAYVASGGTRDQTMLTAPLYFVRSGVINNGVLYYGGQSGTYWSNTALSSTYAYYLGYNHDTINLHDNYARFNGYNIRCVARTGTEPKTVNRAFSDAGKTTVSVSGANYYKMQDMTPSICSAIDEGQEAQLADTRDNKLYWILKAKDGNCWMTQNLDHNIVTTANFYTPDNTDITANWNPERATTTTIDSNGKLTGWTNDNTNPYSADPGDWYSTDTYYNNACNDSPWCRFTNPSAGATTLSKFSRTPFPGNGAHGHVGNFYNWTAAIASNDSSAYTTSTMANPGSSPQTSICPKGWRLPTISSVTQYDEYANLATLYGAYPVTDPLNADRNLFVAPIYMNRAGNIHAGDLNGGGYRGYYLSSTVQSNTNSPSLRLDYTGVIPQDSFQKLYGFSIRCLAK